MDTTEALSVGQTGWAVRRWKLYLIANGLDGLGHSASLPATQHQAVIIPPKWLYNTWLPRGHSQLHQPEGRAYSHASAQMSCIRTVELLHKI